MSRRSKNIYKRKDGRWEGRYIAGYTIAGKANYRSVYAHSYNEVKQKLEEAVLSSVSPSAPKTASVSVNEWFNRWLTTLKTRIKESTYFIYKRYVDNHINPFFANIPLNKLSKDMLQQFVNSKSDLSPATVKDIFTFLRSGLQAAEKEFHLPRLYEDVVLPKAAPQSLRVFSKTEQQRIERYIAVSDNPNHIGVLICLYTGLRIGELCALRWEDVNFEQGTLAVRRTIQRIADDINGGTKIVVSTPKSVSSARQIPLPTFILQKLKNHKERFCKCEYVLHIDGKPIEPRTYQYMFQSLLKNAGIAKAKFHTLRHTFSTRALELGFDIKTLSEILGHASASVTLKIYAHSLDEHKRQSMELLGTLCV